MDEQRWFDKDLLKRDPPWELFRMTLGWNVNDFQMIKDYLTILVARHKKLCPNTYRKAQEALNDIQTKIEKVKEEDLKREEKGAAKTVVYSHQLFREIDEDLFNLYRRRAKENRAFHH